MKRLVLVDGNALLHRAYHATPPLSTSKGELVNAVFGFTTMLLKAWNDLSPDYLAVAWDMRAPTFRKEMFEGYKANRGPADEGLTCQYERVFEVLKAFNIPEFKLPGFEADDLVGTLAKLAEKQEKTMEIIILTGDRDLMQLVDKKIRLYMPVKGLSDTIIVDEEKVMERMGVRPNQIVDYKALVGDSSDNYPGVVGIGPKTAVQLIEEFGSFEKIYRFISTSPLPSPNLGEGTIRKLVDGYEGGELSKRLATIRIDAPVTYNSAQCSTPSPQKITEVLQELGYKSLVKRMGGQQDENSSRPRLFE